MLTIDDIKNLSRIFATKKDIEDFRKESNTKFSGVTTLLDGVMGELKTMRQEWVLHIGAHDRIDKRLTTIEATPTVASELKRKKKPT